MPSKLVDRFGRVHQSLRVSVTDRCNIRCFYCMPEENVEFKPRSELLTYEEISRFVKITSELGINRVRITGGEPLVRTDIADLVMMLKRIEGISDLAMTTNGVLLEKHAAALKHAGLARLNISLDTLREETFQRISRRSGLQAVLNGIAAAMDLGFEKIRLNAVPIAGISEDDIVPLVRFARDHDLEMRFIEFMPLDAEQQWGQRLVFKGESIRARIEDVFGPLVEAERPDPSQPAMDFCFLDGKGKVGFINPVSQPFCETCNRMRITAEGKVRNCLFSHTEWDARARLRSDATDSQIKQMIVDCIAAKRAGHGIDRDDFERPDRSMYQIGG